MKYNIYKKVCFFYILDNSLMQIHIFFILLSKMLKCLLISWNFFFFHFYSAENVSIQKLLITNISNFHIFFDKIRCCNDTKKSCKKKLVYCLQTPYRHKYSRNSYADCLYCDKIEKFQNDDYDEKNLFADSVFAESAVFLY